MVSPRVFQCAQLWLALGVCALLGAGCAGLPRIDPTGERVFIWPQDQVTAVSPTVTNPQAPPVFTDPVFPPPSSTPLPGQPGVVPPIPQDTLAITPQRVLAPVGSEVLLKSRFCTREGYLLTDAKIEWLIARESAGEFVSLGGRGWLRDPWLPWNKSKKIDNQYAIGYTAKVPLTISRGTADVSDDLQVEPGEAWASITSPVEGTSHITAMAPEIETWQERRAQATIYWVDVQWTFPPSSITAGGSQVMSTTLRRQTDGTPLAGWIVRYAVADGGGTLRGNESGQTVEATTDANGQASIDVTPTGAAGSVTRIDIQLIRPPGYRGSDAPQLVVANGSSTIHWNSTEGDYLPPADDLGNTIPATPLPSQPPPATTTRRPRLDLEIYGEDTAQAGGQIRFEVVIRNVGDAEATGIVLSDRFDAGLSHLRDPQRTLQVENTGIGSLAAGDSRSVFLNFDVLQAGRLSHVVTVRCAEGAEAAKQASVNATQPPPQRQATMKIEKSGPRQRVVGEVAPFTLAITNTGEVPLTNLEIADEYPPSLRASPTQQGYERINRGDNQDHFLWRLPRLEVGATTRLDVQCQCIGQAENACSRVQVSAETGTTAGTISGADEYCMSILPAADVVPPGAQPQPVTPSVTPPGASNVLRLGITSFADPVRAGASATYQIIVQNGPTADEQVQLRVLFPAELTPNVNEISTNANVQATLVGNELRFEPVAQLRSGERLEFQITVAVNQPGVRNIIAQLASRNVPNPIQEVKSVNIIGR
ncbi:MAG: hypothetical protein KDA57_08685 [Planctomycetales bacterium]|nr:hypothetical protein [Planctomycetales bacterium]